MNANERDLEHLFNAARVRLAGASDAQIKAEFYDCMQEFLDNSAAWTEVIQINILPNTQDYNVTPSQGQIIRLQRVVNVNLTNQPASMPAFDAYGATIHFLNPYSQNDTFWATVVKNIALPTGKYMIPEMPDWILPRFGYRIVDGVLGRMFNEDRKPYANPGKANYHLTRFRDAIGRARTAVLRESALGTQRWIYPQGFQTRTQRGGISVGNPNKFS